METGHPVLSCLKSAVLCSKKGTAPSFPSIVLPQAIYQVHLQLVVKQIIYNISTFLSLVVIFASSSKIQTRMSQIVPNREGARRKGLEPIFNEAVRTCHSCY